MKTKTKRAKRKSLALSAGEPQALGRIARRWPNTDWKIKRDGDGMLIVRSHGQSDDWGYVVEPTDNGVRYTIRTLGTGRVPAWEQRSVNL